MALLVALPALAAPDPLPGLAAEAMRVATRAIQRTAVDGGCAPFCAPDGKARATTDGPLPAGAFVVGPDGTAAVGLLAARAYALLGEDIYRAVALDSARALARSQRVTGGWPGIVTGEGYTRPAYRQGEPANGRDPTSELRAGVTVDGLRLLLMVADQTGDAEVREAAQYGLRAMLNAQLADGCWPALLPLSAGEPAALDTTAGMVTLLAAMPDHLEAARHAGEWLRNQDLEEADRPVVAEALQALHDADFDAPAPQPSRSERGRLTADRAPVVAEWVGSLDGLGHWLGDGRISIATYRAAMQDLLVYLRDYEPLPEFPGNDSGRPPQHRR